MAINILIFVRVIGITQKHSWALRVSQPFSVAEVVAWFARACLVLIGGEVFPASFVVRLRWSSSPHHRFAVRRWAQFVSFLHLKLTLASNEA